MRSTTDPRTPTCVTCHGPSPGHVKKEAGKGQAKPDRMFTKAAPTPIAERNAACLTCHQKDAKRALWGGSQHETADLACSSCHKIHTNQDKVLARATQTDSASPATRSSARRWPGPRTTRCPKAR